MQLPGAMDGRDALRELAQRRAQALEIEREGACTTMPAGGGSCVDGSSSSKVLRVESSVLSMSALAALPWMATVAASASPRPTTPRT